MREDTGICSYQVHSTGEDGERNKIILYGVTDYNELKDKLKIYEQLKDRINVKTDRRISRCFNCGKA